MFNAPNNLHVQHHGEIESLNDTEARDVVALAMGVPFQCRDIDPDSLVGEYELASGETLIFRASTLVSDGSFLLAFTAGHVEEADLDEVSAIHDAIVALVPIIARGMPLLREVA